MDLDDLREVDVSDIDITDDLGGFEPPDPPRGRGGGGPGRGGERAGDPFLHSPWTSVIAAAVVAFFGLQSVLVVWLARTGQADATTTLALGLVFIVAFTVVFITGSRFIGRHRY